MTQNSRIDAATKCLTDAQIHLDEYLLKRIIDATAHTDSRSVLQLSRDVQKIQRNISAILKNIYNLPL